MPTVLRQLSLIVAALAGVITLFAGRSAGVRASQIGLRTVLAFAIFFVVMILLARAVVAVTPDAWTDVHRPPATVPQVGRRLDLTVPGTSPADVAFKPIGPAELMGSAASGNGAGEVAQRVAADPEAVARLLTAMSQGDQEG